MNINRRTVIAALPFAGAAATVVTVATAHEVQLSPLAAMIEAHKVSWNKFGKVAAQLSRKEDAYRAYVNANGGRPLVSKSLGGAYELSGDGSTAKENIAADYFKQRGRLASLEKIAPQLAEQAREALDRAAAQDLLAVDAAYEQETERKRKFGLTKALQAYEDAHTAHIAALHDICSYRCQTLEEYRMKGLYLTQPEVRDTLIDDEDFDAAIQSSLVEGVA
ncbi:hypothetical protein [Candidatus Phyllobacterium onerii]|uniref:hypothetical protein n=1 Tax=Candidatus Phyllobacterium onerii TaxID=3020828 RepID=UPI00232AA9A6|nr:hypothetical protein [Phyllobacterium sp. IY22]